MPSLESLVEFSIQTPTPANTPITTSDISPTRAEGGVKPKEMVKD